MMILVQTLICILVADFLSGLLHWLEDNYGREDWLIIGDFIIKPNILHHDNPRHFINTSWWIRNRVLFFLAMNTLFIAHLCHFLIWQILLVILIGISANEIHRWAHQTPTENGKIICFLQSAKIIQSPSHHALHHCGHRNTHYCIITSWLNPLLNAVRFWQIIEILLARILGIHSRSRHLNHSLDIQP